MSIESCFAIVAFGMIGLIFLILWSLYCIKVDEEIYGINLNDESEDGR